MKFEYVLELLREMAERKRVQAKEYAAKEEPWADTRAQDRMREAMDIEAAAQELRNATRTLDPRPDRLRITVEDEPGSGGVSHTISNIYEIAGMDASTNPSWDGMNQHKITILMANGPMSAGKPANGLTEAALLAIVIDRLHQRQPDPVIDAAYDHCRIALAALVKPEYSGISG